MNKIIVDCGEERITTALLNDGRLMELFIDDLNESSIVGNIYAGIVKTILPSQFVFIEIGLARTAFLYLNDKKESGLYHLETKKLLVKQGDTMIIQALKDPAGAKGAYATSQLSFKGRFLVINRTGKKSNIGISKKIADLAERDRLKEIVKANLPEGCDVIVRTGAAGKNEAEMKEEIDGLLKKIAMAEKEWKFLKAPALAYNEGSPLHKTLKDIFSEDIGEVVINSRDEYEKALNEFGDFFVNAGERIRFYDGGEPIFDRFFVRSQLQKSLSKRVWLKCGGFIVIEQTEACVVIDVNTGKYAGSKSHEQSVLKVNLEAAVEIAYQLRLRNLGGIIIIDFIDMKEKESVEVLTRRLGDELAKDRITANLVGMTELGLMQLTRKKVRKPVAGLVNAEDY